MLGYSLVGVFSPRNTTSLYNEHPNITNNLVFSVMSDF